MLWRLGIQPNAASYGRCQAAVAVSRTVYFCYIDESGGFEAPNLHADSTPLMVVAGVIVPGDAVGPLTTDLLALNRRFYPNKAHRWLDYVLMEIKGGTLRQRLRSKSHRRRRYAIGVLDGAIELIERYDVRLLGRIWIKEPTEGLKPSETYTFSIQDIARHLNRFLEENDSQGLILCDSRDHAQDVEVAHSVFTRKYKASGDELSRLVEPVVFGRSKNHAGLQLADVTASALLFPIAARVYCAEAISGVHTDPLFDDLRHRYAVRLRRRLYLYKDDSDRTRGGIIVSDRLGRKSSGLLFEL